MGKLALDEMEAGDVYPKVEVGGRISLAPHDRIPATYKRDELIHERAREHRVNLPLDIARCPAYPVRAAVGHLMQGGAGWPARQRQSSK